MDIRVVEKKKEMMTVTKNAHMCQQLSFIEAHCGSTSSGISSRWFINPTAPTTCKNPRETVVHICTH